MSEQSKVKSWVYTVAGYPQTLKLSETTVPASPSPHHVLIRIHAAALNPFDIQLMNFPLISLPGLNGPKIAARDFAGTIIAASPETEMMKGDEVYGMSMDTSSAGFLTDVSHVDVRTTCIVKKPKHLSWVQAASLPLVWLTARTCIEKCVPFMKSATPSENRLAVLGGSSSTGLYTIQIAHERGWTVLSTCSGRNIDFVSSLGADKVVDYTTSRDAVISAVSEFKPSAIIDCVGGVDCIGIAPQYVTIVGDKTSRASLGGPPAYVTHPRMVLRWLLGCIGVGNSYQCISLDVKKEWLEESAKLKGEDEIIIDSTFGFGRAKEAFERMDTGRARGKVVVEMQD